MGLFGPPKPRGAVVFDIAADSVGGACVAIDRATTTICYGTRLPIEHREGEAPEAALGRALQAVGDLLIRQGAPALLRLTGSGRPHQVLASIGAPWAESTVRIERLEGDHGPFVFTKQQLAESLRAPAEVPAGKRFMDETALATFLDGYESKAPIGEKTHRAAIVVLSTVIAEAAAELVATTVRTLYHTHSAVLAAGALTMHRGLALLFPHENEYIALRVAGGVATLLIIRRGTLVAAPNFPLGSNLADALYTALAELARTQPLPRSIFILAEESLQEPLKAAFADTRFAPLWLSDDPPRILPVRAEHLTLGGSLALAGEAEPDLALGLAALFCAHPEP